jgi:hypothetical protein
MLNIFNIIDIIDSLFKLNKEFFLGKSKLYKNNTNFSLNQTNKYTQTQTLLCNT